MSTVRQLVSDLADGSTSMREVVQDFRSRPWPSSRRGLTEGQLHGVDDTPLASDNSPDWIEIQPGLTDTQRQQLRDAYDEAQ